MSKTSLIVFLLMCNNFCNTMDLSETTNTKSNIQQEQYPRIVNPDALTTAKRYGSTLSPQEFDKLVYGREPYFGSDYELCVPDVHVNLEAFKVAYKHMFFVWKIIPAIFEKNALEHNQDVINVIRSFYVHKCDMKFDNGPMNKCHSGQIRISYKEGSQKLMTIEHLKNRNLHKTFHAKALSKIKKQISQCNKKSDENNVAALRKLYDDQSKLINNNNITHQNIIRCLQWQRTIMKWSPKFSCLVGKIAMDHLKNKKYNQDAIISLYEQEESSIVMPVISCHLKDSNDNYNLNSNHTNDSILYIRLNENNEYYISEDQCLIFNVIRIGSLLLDPRYNPEIHGPEGVVWFKYPHEKGFEAGLNGEGSSWMHIKDAEKFLTKQFEQLENMSNISLRKDGFKSLAIKNSLLLATVGLGITGSAFSMAKNSSCSVQ